MSFWDVFNGIAGAVGGIGGSIADNVVNYNISKENLQYQKDYNNTIWNREDSAMQRRMADLKASGLNPLLALGTDGAGAGGTASAPTNAFVSNMREGAYAYRDAVNQSKRLKLESDSVNAEIDLKRAQAENVEQDTEYKRWSNSNNALRSQILELDRKYKENQISLEEYQKELKQVELSIAKHDADLINNSNDTSSSYGKDVDQNEVVTVTESGIPLFFKKKQSVTSKASDYGSTGLNPWFKESDKAEIREETYRYDLEKKLGVTLPLSVYKKYIQYMNDYEQTHDYKKLQKRFSTGRGKSDLKPFLEWWYDDKNREHYGYTN